jgi:hypothetical protein
MTAGVQLTIRYGDFGEHQKIVAVPISDMLMSELMGKLELSNEPFSLMIASPGMYGGKGDAVTIRRKTFEMRRSVAEQIARAMVPELIKAFGVNDELDGYRVADMTADERAWHERQGRLPPEKESKT